MHRLDHITDEWIDGLLNNEPRAQEAGDRLLRDMPKYQVTGRQIQVIRLLAQGCTVKEIAKVLCVQADTVTKHVKSARMRLGARNSAHLVAIAMDEGII